MNRIQLKAPWLRHYGVVPHTLEYPDKSMFDMISETAAKYPSYDAYEFMNQKTTFISFIKEVRICARAFRALGIREGDKVTICLPNLPQTVIAFYALNAIGAVATMVHPLSSEGEIAFFLKDSQSVAAICMDQFYAKFQSARTQVHLPKLIVTGVKDALNLPLRVGYYLTQGRKINKIAKDADIIWWNDFLTMANTHFGPFTANAKGKDPAAILYSGGTTGTSKGILLSNLNFNALAMQTFAMGNCLSPGNSMLSVMPMFHGFGLGVCIHTALFYGVKCILVPRFNVKSYGELLKKKRPNCIAGVPTLFEAITRNPDMEGVDLSYLRGVFSGGDSLSVELKRKFDAFLVAHHASVPIREGYGTTECVTASCLTPYHNFREGSIGLPFPDTFYKIVSSGTTQEVPYGETGEICILGPTVMIEYINQPEETANTLKTHEDGYTWLHTGDLGTMDEDGYVYFKQRIKRMIITSGYNVYPSQLENMLDACEHVQMSCVIGVKDPLKMQKVKAFVVLKDGVQPTQKVKDDIMAYAKMHIAKYAMPYAIEIRESLPKTLVGKIAYTVLEKEENEPTQG